MNILIVSLYPLERNTSVANSSISIINGLKILNHKITIVMPNWANNETGCMLDGMRIIRIPGQPSESDAGWVKRKLHSHVDFLDNTRAYLKYVPDVGVPNEFFDVILSFSDPNASHIFAKRLIKQNKIRYGRWIQHWGDPITGDFTRRYWWPDWFQRLYERRFIRWADKSVYVTPFTRDLLLKEHPTLQNKIAFVPLPAEMLPSVKLDMSNILRVSYLGDYNPRIRNIKPLYEACANKPDMKLTIAGHGPEFPSCNNVTVLSRIPHKQAQEIENDSDVIVCVCNLTGCMIPGKITYKASTSKHILVALEDENFDAMKAYFESYHRYVICRNTAESISEALQNLRHKASNYSTPIQLLPVTVASKILE